MNATLKQRKYTVALRLATDAGMSFGLLLLIGIAVLEAASIVLRAGGSYRGDLSFLAFSLLPLILAAISWVYMLKSFPLAIAGGMTRKEFLTAFAVFGAVVVAAAVVLSQLIVLVYHLAYPEGTDDLGLYGTSPLEALTRSAVYFTAGSAAGAVMARFDHRSIGGMLTGLLVSALLLRQIPLELVDSGYFGNGAVFALEFPSSAAMLAPLDAVLAGLFALVAWVALARAPMPHKKA